MKHTLSYLSLFFLPLALPASEDIARPQSISVRVKEVSSRRKDSHNYRYDTYYYDKDIARSKNVEVEITNFGGKPAPGLPVCHLLVWQEKW